MSEFGIWRNDVRIYGKIRGNFSAYQHCSSKQMDIEEFQKQMQLIDEKLAAKEIPIHARAFHAFPIAAPDFNGPLIGHGISRDVYKEYEGPNLFEKINSWYKQIYGDRFNAPTDRGKVPIILRNEIYLIRIPLVYGMPQIEIFPLVNGITPAMARSLSPREALNKSILDADSTYHAVFFGMPPWTETF